MMNPMKNKWKKGDVLQLDPNYDHLYGSCFMIVTEANESGAKGYFQFPGKSINAEHEISHENAVRIGQAQWMDR